MRKYLETDGAAFYGIVQDENAHDMLRQDFGIVLPMERIIIITGIQQHADRARIHSESPSSKTQTERSKGEETISTDGRRSTLAGEKLIEAQSCGERQAKIWSCSD